LEKDVKELIELIDRTVRELERVRVWLRRRRWRGGTGR